MYSTLKEITKEEIYNMTTRQRVELFEELLRSTKRDGIDNVIEYIKTTDFFTAPASTSHHSNCEGGLLIHSLLVYSIMVQLYKAAAFVKPNIFESITEDNIIIVSLLHDICKINTYTKGTKNVKDETGWKAVETYNYTEEFPYGHGEKSVLFLTTLGLKLEPNELLAIRWHMGNWDLPWGTTQKSYITARLKTPLVVLITSADDMSSVLLEDVYKPRVIG